MKRLAIGLTLLSGLLSSLVHADVETHFGVGVGTQYGGGPGLKYSLGNTTNKFYVGAGRTDFFRGGVEEYGVTLGWEKSLTKKHSLGMAVRTRTLLGGGSYQIDSDSGQPVYSPVKDGYEAFAAGTYTYYFKDAQESGFLTGLSLGKSYRRNNVQSEFKSGMEYGLFFGYQF